MSEPGIAARTRKYGIRYLCLGVWNRVWVALDFAVLRLLHKPRIMYIVNYREIVSKPLFAYLNRCINPGA